ncbi:SAM-dependent methyltransferase [Actinokineospora enzanensis]|uniref:SAM-dependent methyltransferase n=1 Tax=Actinokineospora enzanensis TaxID=155975 RepID=UPI0003662011|nr:SAM-dependent methyltransferase [Actinokineospora enzanensis]
MSEEDPYQSRPVDLERPSVARVYDYLLGGDANWAVDREFADRVLVRIPLLRSIARANRQFLRRAVRHLVGLGVRQFVDIGSGVPTMGNTHQIAESAAPVGTRVVYVDNDPVAVAQSRVLLENSGDPTRHTVVTADLRDPDKLWAEIADTGVIDLDKPIALLIIAVLHVHQPDPRTGEDIGPISVARYRDLLPGGSYLALSHLTDQGVPEELGDKLGTLKDFYDQSGNNVIWRNHADITALFGDFALVEPGLTWTPSWHPEHVLPDEKDDEFDTPAHSTILAGIGHKAG